MAENASGLIRSSKKLGALGLGSFTLAAAFMGLGSATASAEVNEVAPSPIVTSPGATNFSEGAIRSAETYAARGAGATRNAPATIVHAVGTVKESTKAVVGICAETVWGTTLGGGTQAGAISLAASPQC